MAIVISVVFMTNPVSGSKTPVTEPPTLVMQDALSSSMSLRFINHSGSYSWGSYSWAYPEYPDELRLGEFIELTVCGNTALSYVDSRNYIQLKQYNKIDYVPYLLSFVTDLDKDIEPDRMVLEEYEISAINNMETEAIQTIELTNSLVKIKPNRVYVLTADWNQENVKNNKFYGKVQYVFVTE